MLLHMLAISYLTLNNIGIYAGDETKQKLGFKPSIIIYGDNKDKTKLELNIPQF